MLPEFINGNVRANCPGCGGARSMFEHRDAQHEHGTVSNFVQHMYQGRGFTRFAYVLMHCGGCGRGGLATIHCNDQVYQGVLECFYPLSRDFAPIPKGAPADVVSEFREAELCASAGAWRGASALLRSTIEKTLIANGYVRGSLADKIDEAAGDGVITAARQRRAHDEVRVLGNDVLHDPWRIVTEEEYQAAHHYAQRIIEDFYDNRAEVEVVLRRVNRIPP